MKKNTMMRIASVLLVAVLLSTCTISGTFAKYTTADSAQDVAKVAKFGVTVTSAGKLFADTYKTSTNTPGKSGDSTGNAYLSVVSAAITAAATDHDGIAGADANKIVAPGTKSETAGLSFAFVGKPEVATTLSIAVTSTSGAANPLDIFLKAKDSLPKMTTGDATDTFSLSADYHPIKYAIACSGSNTAVEGTNLTLADVESKLEALSGNYDANYDFAANFGTITITWEWAYGTGDTDDADTLLGDLAAGTTLVPTATLTDGSDYELDTNLKIDISVTQID